MEPKYVTFEQEKWLNSIGFDVELRETKYGHEMPEQHQVVDWLLEKHGIFVEVFADDTEESHNDWIYLYNITMTRKKGESRIWIDGPDKDSPKEAYSAAFDYIKNNNLI
jgi:hypothetical protein